MAYVRLIMDIVWLHYIMLDYNNFINTSLKKSEISLMLERLYCSLLKHTLVLNFDFSLPVLEVFLVVKVTKWTGWLGKEPSGEKSYEKRTLFLLLEVQWLPFMNEGNWRTSTRVVSLPHLSQHYWHAENWSRMSSLNIQAGMPKWIKEIMD